MKKFGDLKMWGFGNLDIWKFETNKYLLIANY
jgi:hypothetical protein